MTRFMTEFNKRVAAANRTPQGADHREILEQLCAETDTPLSEAKKWLLLDMGIPS
jgi:hypothetical protein